MIQDHATIALECLDILAQTVQGAYAMTNIQAISISQERVRKYLRRRYS